MPSFRVSSQPRNGTRVSCIAGSSLPAELPGKPKEEGWEPKNWCFQIVVLEKTLESPLEPLGLLEIKPVNPKGNQPWIFIGSTDAEAEAPELWPPDAKSPLWKRLQCWERLKVKGEGGGSGWDGWMTSLTQWTWVWANSRRWCGTGKPAVLQFTGSQRVGYNWVTEQQFQGLLTLDVHWSYLGDFYIKISLSGSWVFPSAI